MIDRCIAVYNREEPAGKPDPVPRASYLVLRGGDHLSRTPVTRRLERPTRNRSAGHRWFLLGLAPGGACPATAVTCRTGELLPHRFTLTRLAPGGLLSVALAACRHAWELPSTLPCGVRTFLTSLRTASRGRLADSSRCPQHTADRLLPNLSGHPYELPSFNPGAIHRRIRHAHFIGH